VDLIRRSVAQQEHSVQLCQLGTEVFVLLQGDLYAAIDAADRLRGRILDLALI
jgi:predicted GNAT family N-acyltransferase